MSIKIIIDLKEDHPLIYNSIQKQKSHYINDKDCCPHLKPELSLEVGGYYRRRDGCVVGPILGGSSSSIYGYPFTDGNYTYKANGIQHSFSPGDLIEEVPNPNINKMESKTITVKNAQRIIEVACSSWKTKLATQWGTAIALGDNIEISNDDYVKMRGVCTPNQHMLFDEIFGGDVWKMEGMYGKCTKI